MKSKELQYLEVAMGMLATTPLEDLRNVERVETIICVAGLYPDNRQLYGDYNRYQNPRYGLWQIPRQFAELLVYLSDKNIRTVLEIGTFHGFTTAILDAYLKRFAFDFKLTSIDPNPFLLNDLIRDWEYVNTTSDSYRGEKFDLVFIDGDHLAEKASEDYENVGKHARFCAFHDINDEYVDLLPDGGVGKFWKSLTGKKTEFTYHSENRRVMGIGLVENSPT